MDLLMLIIFEHPDILADNEYAKLYLKNNVQ